MKLAYIIDPRTDAGFEELAQSHGARSALRARIGALESDIAKSRSPFAHDPRHALQRALATAYNQLNALPVEETT